MDREPTGRLKLQARGMTVPVLSGWGDPVLPLQSGAACQLDMGNPSLTTLRRLSAVWQTRHSAPVRGMALDGNAVIRNITAGADSIQPATSS